MQKEILKPGLRLQSSMGEIVLARLGQMVDFEKAQHVLAEPGCVEVVIAGQAVASAISELFGDGSAVAYNDVDAFALANPLYLAKLTGKFCQEKPTKVLLKSVLQTSATLAGVDNYGALTTQASNVFRLGRSAREGLLNMIYGGYFSLGGPFSQADVRRFLGIFDLNCVQVGVRLSDKALVWTPAFERFLATRELLVQNVGTPLHTALRWAKKKQELPGIFGNDEAAMDLLSAAALREELLYKGAARPDVDLKPWVESAASLLFSAKFEEMYQRHAATLSPYFTLKGVPTRKLPLFTLERRGVPTLSEDALLALPRDFLTTYFRASRMFYGKNTSRKLLDLFAPFTQPRESGKSLQGKVLYKLPVACRDGMHHVVQDREFKDLDFVEKLVNEHRGLTAMALSGFSYDQMRVLGKALVELSKTRGLHVFGLIDTYAQSEIAERRIAELHGVGLDDLAEAVRAFVVDLEKEVEAMKNTATYLFPRAVSRIQIGQYRVEELRDPVRLHQEGSTMHHCVGGYTASVLRGASGIFHLVSLDNPKDRATLEVKKVPTTGKLGVWAGAVKRTDLRKVQLRGAYNASASDGALVASQRLVNALRLRESVTGFDRLPMGVLLWVADRLPGHALDVLTRNFTVSISKVISLLRLAARRPIGRLKAKAAWIENEDFPY